MTVRITIEAESAEIETTNLTEEELPDPDELTEEFYRQHGGKPSEAIRDAMLLWTELNNPEEMILEETY